MGTLRTVGTYICTNYYLLVTVTVIPGEVSHWKRASQTIESEIQVLDKVEYLTEQQDIHLVLTSTVSSCHSLNKVIAAYT